MTSEQLRSTRDAVPFSPFVIHMTDGRSFTVPHRDYLYILPNGRVAYVSRLSGDAADTIDVMHITSLSPTDSSASPNGPGTNGQ